jgi:hypothetical protein
VFSGGGVGAAASQASLRASAVAAAGASKAMTGVAGALGSLSAASGGATAALGAIGLAIGFMIYSSEEQRKYAEKAKANYDARFGVNVGKSEDQVKKEAYVGPNSEQRKADLENQKGFWGYIRSHTGPTKGTGNEQDRRVGKISSETQTMIDAAKKQSSGELELGKGNDYANLMLTKEGRVAQILKAQEVSGRTLGKVADQIKSNKDMSDQQKTTALAQIEQIQKDNKQVVENLILNAQGLGDVNALTAEQIGQIDEFMQTTQNLSVGTAQEFATALSQMQKNMGLGEGADIKPVLAKMGQGGQSQVEALKGQLEATKLEAKSAAAEFVAYSNGGGDKEQIDEARQNMAQKIAQITQIEQSIMQAEAQSGTDFATFLSNRGDFSGAAQALDAAIAALRAEANKPGQAADKKIALSNQADALAKQQSDLRIQDATDELEAAKMRTRNQGEVIKNDLAIAQKTLEERRRAFKTGGATRGDVRDAEQAVIAAQNAQTDHAQAITQSQFSLQSAQTLNGVAKATVDKTQALQALAFAEANFGKDSQEYLTALTAVITSSQTLTQAAQDQAQSVFQLQAAKTNDPVAKAGAGIRGAQNEVDYALKTYKKDSVQYNNALASLWGSRQAYAQAEASQRASEFSVRAARTLNAVAKAQVEVAAARDAYNTALASGDQTAANGALAQLYGAQQAARQARQDEAAAKRETNITKMAPGSAVAIARARLANARQAQRDARQFGRTSTQYQQATQQVIEAARAVNDAVIDVFKANSSLGIALAEAAGRTVDAARLRLQEANREVARAKQKSGGVRSADVVNAEAGQVAAEAAYRDAALQDKLDTIDFNQSMGTLTARGAIAALQAILKATNLTKQQRRELQLKIKGLQDDLRANLTGSGFNIPDQIKLPSAYEVRRSLGIDKYAKFIHKSVEDSYKNPTPTAPGTVKALTAATSLTAAAAPVTSNSNAAVVSAVNAVQAAVAANGAQVVNDVKVTNMVTQPAMVEQVAKRVVELIQQQTVSGARANQATPKLVSY